MRIVVDTNIVFSAMLNTNSRIARIILRPKTRFNFYSTHMLVEEIHDNSDKLIKLSGYSKSEFERIFTIFSNKFRFINNRLIPDKIYKETLRLTEDVDVDDTEFVALTEHIKGRFWSGDKELKNGLIKKGWDRFISTQELFEIAKENRI